MNHQTLLRRAGGAFISIALVSGVYTLVEAFVGPTAAAIAAVFVVGFALYAAGQPAGTALGADNLEDQYD
ncbi:hypothetical protein [Halococcus hamelinensis]|uniref:Uncharacterized protein n=1 Tax=Halococcus hamelinensis 100A6 TaxID=1132509 RepID=M0LXY4_9EURY|nr:hypothetical protein [Halococcus hamelinensis]EMA38452.1 hypothetical protein C447_09867 [Halococcus hamelinensis 100A6]